MKATKSPLIIILILFFSFNFSFSQVKNNQYKTTVFEVYGDLNKDQIPDLVTVKENEDDPKHPFLLEIFFKNKSGNYEKVFTSEKAVMELYPYGDRRTDLILKDLKIENGILIFKNELIRGSFIHRFRYQNGRFELIGFTSMNAIPGYIEHIDFNLSTGDKIVKLVSYETDKVLKLEKTKQKISPLPNLIDFEPFDFTY